MKFLVFFVLVSYTANCDESNYYVIQMPEEDVTKSSAPLQVYWNVPTMQCTSKKIPFKNLDRFGILQNRNDSFRGEMVSIMYDPGIFPALFRNESSGNLRFRNGGVPQEGDLDVHVKSFKSVLDQSIPDEGFSGIGIIDFESWRPILRQNFGEVLPYKSISYEIERKKHWWWPQPWIQEAARQRFEEAGKLFMQTTLAIAKQMRPKAKWGYYGFPYCFNMAANNMKEGCAKNVDGENDQINWLWTESTALYPSVYSFKSLTSMQLSQLIRGRVKEAARVRRKNAPILPYFWFRYRDGGFLSQEDLNVALQTFHYSEAEGFLIWGSSNDVNTVDKCKLLLNYVENVMGPAIAKYTLQNNKDNKQQDDHNIASTDNNLTSTSAASNEMDIGTKINYTTIEPFLSNENTKVELITSTEESTTNHQDVIVIKDDIVTNFGENIKTQVNKLNQSILIDLITNSFSDNSDKKNDFFLLIENEQEEYLNTTEKDFSYEDDIIIDITDNFTSESVNYSNDEISTTSDSPIISISPLVVEDVDDYDYEHSTDANILSITKIKAKPDATQHKYTNIDDIILETTENFDRLHSSTYLPDVEMTESGEQSSTMGTEQYSDSIENRLESSTYLPDVEMTENRDELEESGIIGTEPYLDSTGHNISTFNKTSESNEHDLESSVLTDVFTTPALKEVINKNLDYAFSSKDFKSSTEFVKFSNDVNTESNINLTQDWFFNPSIFGEFAIDYENETLPTDIYSDEYSDLRTKKPIEKETVDIVGISNNVPTKTDHVIPQDNDIYKTSTNIYQKSDSGVDSKRRKTVSRSTNEDLITNSETLFQPMTSTEQVLVRII